MKNTTSFLCAIVFVLLSLNAFPQQKTGQIYLIRATGYVSSAVNFRVFIDDALACKLKNKTYSIHTVNAGEHTVSAQNTGISNHKRSAPFKVKVEEGKITYVDVAWANDVYCQEITPNSATMILKKTKLIKDCGTNEQ